MTWWRFWQSQRRKRKEQMDQCNRELDQALARTPEYQAQIRSSTKKEKEAMARSLILAEETLRVLRKTRQPE